MAGRRGTASSVDALGALAACVVVVVAFNADIVRTALDVEITFRFLTLSAAAVGAAAAILGVVVTRLTGEPRTTWIAAALVLYCVVVLPWFVEGPLLTVAVLFGWTATAVAFVVDGHRRGSRARALLGLGLVVLAAAQLYRVAVSIPTGGLSAPASDLAFAALRLLGLAVMLVALARLTSRALGTLASEQWRQQEELAVAAVHMERAGELAAERDHELRNGLAGLAGITHLLSSDASGTEHDRLRHAVLAELSRLHTILDGGDVPAEGPRADYLVEPVLSGLVALRPVGGVTLSVPDGLAAHGDSAVLAQIVTNFLANCDRHAPGAPVTIRARADRAGVVVEVRDAGPGLPAGAEEAAPGRAFHDEAAGGAGLGLRISRRLVATQGGSLSLRTVTDPCGCLATVTVPTAQATGPIGAQRSR